jgi:MoaA/NifB/PqqE/SkfB family radical SAM enzyme
MLGKKKITTVWLVINSDCNNYCKFCYYVNRDSSFMSFENIKRYKKLIDKINPSKLVLIGGEPTIHKDFLNILKLFSKRKYKLSIVSNGTTLVDSNFCRIVLDSVDNITLSVQGDQNIHNKVVNNEHAFQNITKSIKNILFIKKEMLNTNTVVTTDSIKHIKKIIRKLYLLGIRKFGFNICTSFDKSLY